MIKLSYLALAISSALGAPMATASEAQNNTETIPYEASAQNSLNQTMLVYEGIDDTRILGKEFEKTLYPGETFTQDLTVNGYIPGQAGLTIDHILIDGFFRWESDRDNNTTLIITEKDSQKVVYSGPLALKQFNSSSLALRIPQSGATAANVAKLTRSVTLEKGKQYQVAFKVEDDSQKLTFRPLEHLPVDANTKRIAPSGQEEELDFAIFMRLYGEAAATDYGVSIKSASENKLAFDPGYSLPYPEKLIDPSSDQPEQLTFDLSSLADKDIEFSIVNKSIASINVEKLAHSATVDISALSEGETHLLVKADGELVATVGLQSYRPIDVPVSFREAKMPDVPITQSRFDEVSEYLTNIYKPLNVKLHFFDLGVQKFDWQSNETDGYDIPPPEDSEKYFSNLFLYGDDIEGNMVSCTGGNGSSGKYKETQSYYGFKLASRYCNNDRAIATLAHELGHNLSLAHYTSRGLNALPSEYTNLMKTGRNNDELFGFQWRIIQQNLQRLQQSGGLPKVPSKNRTLGIPSSYSEAYARNQLLTEIPILPQSVKSEGYKVEIVKRPTAGVAVANSNGTISYRHVSPSILSDQVIYRLFNSNGTMSEDIVLNITIENDTTSNTKYDGMRGDPIDDYVALAKDSQTTIDILENDKFFHSFAVPDLDYYGEQLFALNSDGTMTIEYDKWVKENKIERATYVHDYINTPEVDMVPWAPIYIKEITPEGPAATANNSQIKVNFGQDTLISPTTNDIDNGAGIDHQGVNVRQHPQHGLIEVNEQGQLVYRHDGSDTSADSFTYRVKDSYGRLSNLATVTLDIEKEHVADEFTIVWPSLEKAYSLTDKDGLYIPLELEVEDGDSETYRFVATVNNVSTDTDKPYKLKGKVGKHTPNLHITEPGTYRVVVRVTNEFGDKEKKVFKFKVTDDVVEDFDIHWDNLKDIYHLDSDGYVFIPLALSVENGTSNEYTYTATTSHTETGDNIDTQHGVIGSEGNKYIRIHESGDYQVDVVVKNPKGNAETETYFFTVKSELTQGKTTVEPLKETYTLTKINDYPWLVVPVTLTGYADNINTHVGIFNEANEHRVAYANTILNEEQTLVLNVKGPGVSEGHYTVKVWTTDDDAQHFPIYVENMDVEEEFDFVYPDGLGSYSAGTKVQGSDGGIYQCKSYPASGWCNVDSAEHYAPGTGSNWEDAWTKVTAGDGTQPEPGDYPSYVVGDVYATGDKVSHLQRNFECKVSGWCSSGSTSSWAYEPGVGLYWDQAWTELIK